MEHKFTMSLSLNVLNHLGINLYSNVPAVLSEIVANSWDADAENVTIAISSDEIIIEDNGCGMTVSDINSHFLKVGYQKREDETASSKFKRRFMGRKGIGNCFKLFIGRINNAEICTLFRFSIGGTVIYAKMQSAGVLQRLIFSQQYICNARQEHMQFGQKFLKSRHVFADRRQQSIVWVSFLQVCLGYGICLVSINSPTALDYLILLDKPFLNFIVISKQK